MKRPLVLLSSLTLAIVLGACGSQSSHPKAKRNFRSRQEATNTAIAAGTTTTAKKQKTKTAP